MFDRTWDATVRNASFEWLKAQVATYGDVLPRTLLEEGFPLDGARVPLLSPKGIFKPRVLREAPLSITTAPNGPYDDAFGPNDLLRYRYRGTDPEHADNRGLRFAMQERLPLVYLHGLVPGRAVPAGGCPARRHGAKSRLTAQRKPGRTSPPVSSRFSSITSTSCGERYTRTLRVAGSTTQTSRVPAAK